MQLDKEYLDKLTSTLCDYRYLTIDHITTLYTFYLEYLSPEDTYAFLNTNLRQVTTRRMINTVQRLVSLADDIIKIRKGDGIRIFFLMTAIEYLYTLGKKKKKYKEAIIDLCEKYVSDNNKKNIKEKIEITIDGEEYIEDSVVTPSKFAQILYEIRNRISHEGDYYSSYFLPNEMDYPSISDICVLFEEWKEKKEYKKKRIWLNITITYNEVQNIITDALICYIKDYSTHIKRKKD